MKRIYVDNAATTFPKPKEVSAAVCNYIENIGGNAGRGTSESAYSAGRVVYETREQLCDLFHFPSPMQVAFTANVTHSLNTILKGGVMSGEHVMVSSMEHNAVLRPLQSLSERGVEVTKIPCKSDGSLDVEVLEKYVQANTKMVVMTHASNVCGTVLPIEEVGKWCKKKGFYFILDAAQSAGVLDIEFDKFNLSALAFTGHKGLLGPQGVGGFLIEEEFSNRVKPFIEGGTGSFSERESQPDILPDKFESGTLNLPGIFGLNASLKYINKIGVKEIREKEKGLSQKFLEGILNMEGIRLCGMQGIEGRTAVFSIDFDPLDNAEAGFILDRNFGIATRVGLHCAPSAHKTLGTFPQGTVRFSFGYYNTEEEVKYIIESIYKTIRML